jgi:AcrR family transcriptional regulator
MNAEATEIRQKRRKEERPDEILAAALTVFTRDGFSGARLDDIADLAGCTKGTIYVYFASKEELFKAVVRKMITPEYRQVDTILGDENIDTRTRIARFVKGAYRQIVNSPTHLSMLRLLVADGPKFPDLVDFYHSEIPRIGFEIMKKTLDDGISRGEIRPVDTNVAPLVIFGPIVAENMRRLLNAQRNVEMESLIDTHLDILFNGLFANRPAK